MRKSELPEFLKDAVSQAKYERWLHRKAIAHVRHDRKSNRSAANEKYKLAIHEAVKDSRGMDAYTDEKLDWSLISKFDNADAKRGGREYKNVSPYCLQWIIRGMERDRLISPSALGEQMTLKATYRTRNSWSCGKKVLVAAKDDCSELLKPEANCRPSSE